MNEVRKKTVLICSLLALLFPGCAAINTTPSAVSEKTVRETPPEKRISFPAYGISIRIPPESWEIQRDPGKDELVLWRNSLDGSIIEIMVSRSSRNLSYHNIAVEFTRATCDLILRTTPSAKCDIVQEKKVHINQNEFYKVNITYHASRADMAVKSVLYLHKTRSFAYHFIFMEECHGLLAAEMMRSVVFLDEKLPDEARINKTGQLSLIDACYYGNTEAVEKLLAAGADVNARDKNGVSALSYASDRGHLDIVKMLLANNADVDARSNIGSTPLMNAAFMGHLKIFELLVAHGADVNAQSMEGTTALMNAAAHGYKGIVDILLDRGVEVNACESCGLTALWNAVTAGRADIVEALIAYGADINAAADDGTTTLMNAVFMENIDIVKMLIAAGADVNAKSDNGLTALKLAKRKGNAAIVKLLKQAGAVEDSPLGPILLSLALS